MLDRGRNAGPYRHRTEARGTVRADPRTLFSYLDDPVRFGEHMTRASAAMPGSMRFTVDARGGRVVGAQVRMEGRVLGLPLQVDEVVDAYEPGRAKSWRTVGVPRLIVLARYRMGFEVRPRAGETDLLVFVEWDPLRGWWGAMLERAARRYAAWCADSVVHGAQRAFAGPAVIRPSRCCKVNGPT